METQLSYLGRDRMLNERRREIDIAEVEVVKALKKMKSRKSAGLGGSAAETL